MTRLDVYEYGQLKIDDKVFTRKHWKSFVELNETHGGKYFDVLHNGLRFKQFVGVIQVDGLIVHIHPKADKDDPDTEKWRNVLLDMLKACKRINADTADNAKLDRQNINLLEIYFEYFLRELETLIHQGLVKKYRKETGNVKALKGKLDFAGNIRHNLVHKERFYTTHQVYDVNHALHQVLSCALSIVDQFTRGTRLGDKTKRVLLAFPEVTNVRVNQQFLSNIKIDRKTASYERACELAKFIILNYSPDINHGKQKMIALLFDMNELWEEYVLVQIRKEINNSNSEYFEKFSVGGQTKKYFWGYNYLQPDIELIHKDTKQVFIVDTKWKRPGNAASTEDLRQVYAYARFWDATNVMLLYPGEESRNRSNYYKNNELKSHKDPDISFNHYCHMGFVNVVDDKGKLIGIDVNAGESLGAKVLRMVTTRED